MTNTSSSINISINSILIWLSIFIILSLLIYILISQVKTNSTSDVPLGTIIASAATTAPDGYLPCDGSEVAGDKYPKLQDLIGGTLPNLKGKFLRGCNTEDVLKVVDKSTTAVNGLIIDDHIHEYKSYNSGGSYQPGSGNFIASQSGSYSTSRGINNVYTDGTTTSPVQSATLSMTGDDETAPEHVFVNFFIKAK